MIQAVYKVLDYYLVIVNIYYHLDYYLVIVNIYYHRNWLLRHDSERFDWSTINQSRHFTRFEKPLEYSLFSIRSISYNKIPTFVKYKTLTQNLRTRQLNTVTLVAQSFKVHKFCKLSSKIKIVLVSIII